MTDMVNHPPHYTSHPSGIETIEITENLSFCLGNAFKYLARYRHKGTPVTDIKKAVFYLERSCSRDEQINVIASMDMLEWAEHEESILVSSVITLLASGYIRLAREACKNLLQEVQNEYSA